MTEIYVSAPQMCYFLYLIQSNLYIKETLWNLNMYPLWAVAFYIIIYRLNVYAMIINGKNEAVIYRQWFVSYRCPLRQVWLDWQFKNMSEWCYCVLYFVLFTTYFYVFVYILLLLLFARFLTFYKYLYKLSNHRLIIIYFFL